MVPYGGIREVELFAYLFDRVALREQLQDLLPARIVSQTPSAWLGKRHSKGEGVVLPVLDLPNMFADADLEGVVGAVALGGNR